MTTLNTLLEDSAARHGPRPALRFNPGYRTRTWTYADLLRDVSAVATWLSASGVGKGDRVILWAHNSPSWAVAFLGILRAGAIAVPLDVRSGPRFVDRVIAQTEPRLALLSSGIARDWQRPLAAHAVEDLPPAGLRPIAFAAFPAVDPDDIAEIVFTSGTTGDPKGVVLTHGNIRANVESIDRLIPSRPDHRLVSILPLSHMLEQTAGLLMPLHGGASVYYPASRQSTAIFRALQECRATMLLLVPQALDLFMQRIEREVAQQGKERQWRAMTGLAVRLPMRVRRFVFRRLHRRMGGCLRFIVTGGARLDPALADKWERLGLPIVEGYGATEASPVIAATSVDARRHPSAGAAVPGVEVRTAGDGEILVRGPSVTQGYWNNPAATAEAIRDGWYHTGDLGRIDGDGYLHVQGRKKELIVLQNGQNVFPDDVERELLAAPGVAAATVIGLPASNGPQVHGVIVPDGPGVSAAAVARNANARLAAHQRVRGVTIWPEPEFPLSLTLKVKRREVLAAVQAMRDGGSPAPATASDAASRQDPLYSLIARVADVPPASVRAGSVLIDDIGLDSLSIVELLAAVEAELDVYIDESRLAPDTTAGQLAKIVAGHAGQARPAFPRWPVAAPARVGRLLLQPLLLAPLPAIAPAHVAGRERLRGLDRPVVFAANHASHFDTPVILRALPGRVRRRTAVAAAADYFFTSRRAAAAAGVFLNAFPFSRTTAVRPTLEHCGWLLDRGWSILLYPEGTRSPTGEMAGFKAGVGLLAVELEVPVVPIRTRGTFDVLPRGRARPRPGRVEVVFGDPVSFCRETPYEEAAAQIERAVSSL